MNILKTYILQRAYGFEAINENQDDHVHGKTGDMLIALPNTIGPYGKYKDHFMHILITKGKFGPISKAIVIRQATIEVNNDTFQRVLSAEAVN